MQGSPIASVATDSTPRPLAELVGDPSSPVLATAIHAGHDLRPDVERCLALDETTRLREEDPFTDRFTACADARLVVFRSRFEVDLNRGRDEAVYREPEDAWGLDLWRDGLPDEVVERSLDLYDAFYESLAAHLDAVAQGGPFVVFDLHSYNHRRQGPDAPPDPPEENPDVNVGTASLDRDRWGEVVDTFIEVMRGARVDGAPLDVRENVRFGGANLARWVHERYPGIGCALALEMKKTFMDEWTGRPDAARLEALTSALRPTVPAVVEVVRAGR